MREAGTSKSTLAAYATQLLGADPTLNARQVAKAAGADLAEFDEYWLAMGFPNVDPDRVSFTEEDVRAFKRWKQLSADEGISKTTALSLIRAQSYLADRLALWQLEALVEDTVQRLGLDDTSARLVTIDQMEGYVGTFEAQLEYTWRRQMFDLLARIANEVAHRPADHSKRRFPLTRTLGFVDMVSFTKSSGDMGSNMVRFIERFEYVCRSAVAKKGGRVVKMIGDSVFFASDELETGVRVVTHLMDTLEAADDILPVRASLIRGDVFSRSGDIFGPPVNLAARLVGVASPGQVLTDSATAAAIAASRHLSDITTGLAARVELRGVGRVLPYTLQWNRDALQSADTKTA